MKEIERTREMPGEKKARAEAERGGASREGGRQGGRRLEEQKHGTALR